MAIPPDNEADVMLYQERVAEITGGRPDDSHVWEEGADERVPAYVAMKEGAGKIRPGDSVKMSSVRFDPDGSMTVTAPGWIRIDDVQPFGEAVKLCFMDLETGKLRAFPVEGDGSLEILRPVVVERVDLTFRQRLRLLLRGRL